MARLHYKNSRALALHGLASLQEELVTFEPADCCSCKKMMSNLLLITIAIFILDAVQITQETHLYLESCAFLKDQNHATHVVVIPSNQIRLPGGAHAR